MKKYLNAVSLSAAILAFPCLSATAPADPDVKIIAEDWHKIEGGSPDQESRRLRVFKFQDDGLVDIVYSCDIVRSEDGQENSNSCDDITLHDGQLIYTGGMS